MVRTLVLLTALALAGSACSSSSAGESAGIQTTTSGVAESGAEKSDAPTTELFPDVLDVELIASDAADTYTINATLSSPYDSAARYADAWRIVDSEGNVLGIRELAHDHAGEQPFTRSLSSVVIPADIERITVEGRDQQSGWGGATVTVEVPR